MIAHRTQQYFSYLKVPVELCQFALSAKVTRAVQVYLASKFLFKSGKVHLDQKPAQQIAGMLNISERTVKRQFKWLIRRDWIGKDVVNCWLFFRGFAWLHKIESFNFARAAIMHKEDLYNCKAFLSAAFLSSLSKTGTGKRAERARGRSEHLASPVSLNAIAKILNVSTKSAQRLRKLAADCNYISSRNNFIPITNLAPIDLQHLRSNDINSVTVKLKNDGNLNVLQKIPTKFVRFKKGKLFMQTPNLIESKIRLKAR